MVFCNNCKQEVEVDVDEANGFSCCTSCGQVLDETTFSAEVTFTKGAGGISTADGQFVSDVAASRGLGRISGGRLYGYQLDSHERSLNRGRSEVTQLVDHLGIRPRDDSIESSSRLYQLALQRGFTRGRRTALVAAACLYIVCRQDSKPFMLIDFSDALQINVFMLGNVFLQLCKLLRLQEQPMFTRPVDPSLYLHRFADRLGVRDKFAEVTSTALRLVASMKRDWMQTGRRPSGICGAALYIAAHVHGIAKNKQDVVGVVHVGEATLLKRVKEFALTASSNLTAEDFEEQVVQLEEQHRKSSQQPALPSAGPAENAAAQIGCLHIGSGATHFAHGMCKLCFEDFIEATGGMSEGADPPAYNADAQPKRKRKRKGEDDGEEYVPPGLEQEDYDYEQQELAAVLEEDAPGKYTKAVQLAGASAPQTRSSQRQKLQSTGGASTGVEHGSEPGSTPLLEWHEQAPAAQQSNTLQEGSGPAPEADDEELSDLDESEAGMYLHTEEEAKLKEVIWTELNRDFLDKQQVKAAAAAEHARKAAAQNAAYGLNAAAGSEQEGADAPPKKRPRGRPLGSKTKPRPEDHLNPAQTAEEAARRMLDSKKLSNKINYDVLADLFNTDTIHQESPAGNSASDKARQSYDKLEQPVNQQAARRPARTLGSLRDGFRPKASTQRPRRIPAFP